MAPIAMSAIVATTASGSRIRTVVRTRSTQKFPMRSVRERVNPRISATATAIPTAAGHEVLDREAGHLREMTHRRLARVGLPVRVRHEGRRGVERERRVDTGEAKGQREVGLQSLEHEQHQHADEREGDHRGGVHRPALVGARVDADGAVEQALDGQVALAGEHPSHVVAQRAVEQAARATRESGRSGADRPWSRTSRGNAPGRVGRRSGRRGEGCSR